MRAFILTLGLTTALASATCAFDGQRRGFVIGGGLGFAPFARWSAEASYGSVDHRFSESRVGAAAHFVMGYAPSNSTMLVYLGNAAAYNSNELRENQVTQGFNGLGLYKFLGESRRPIFVTAAAGVYGFDTSETGTAESRFGWLLGLGTEYSRHWQIGLYFASGSASAESVHDNLHLSHLSLIISVLAY